MKIGDYEIEAELGVGGMAKVYRAKHAFLETMHAIKVLDPEYRANPEARRRFLDEAKIQAKHLRHDNIVKVTNIVATEQHAALVMELVDGGSLESLVHDLKGKPDEIKRIMVGVLEAIGHAHAAGIIHRDLKPANVLLAREGGVLVPKVTDFGIAKVIDLGDKKEPLKVRTQFAARMGTLPYMSPEQIRHAKDVTARSDVWSLGAMLYELATGALPFPGESDFDVMEAIVNGKFVPPATKHPGIDRAIAAVIEKALSVDPAQRYASCAEMAAALREAPAAAPKPPPAPPPSPPRAPATPPRAATPPPVPEAAQKKGKVGLVAGLCLVGAAGLGGAAFYISRGSDSVAPATGSAAGSATGSGSATVDPRRAVAALRKTAAQIDAGDPWEATGSATWRVDPKAFPEGAEAPPRAASSVGSTKFVMLHDDKKTTRQPGDGDVAKINFKMWRVADRRLVDSNIGAAPVDFRVSSSGLGRSEVLQLMTKGDVARLWTEVSLHDEAGASNVTPVLFEIELVSFASSRCKGSYRSEDGLAITLTGDPTGPCGNYVFIDTSTAERPMCAGALTCNGPSSAFECTYRGVNVRLEGSVTWLCDDAELTADVTIGGTTTPWKLPAVED